MASMTECARHPSVETGLRCVTCDTPICPRCAVDAPVGMRCPSCAKPDRGGGLRRRPEQIAPALGVALVGALSGAIVLGIVGTFGFLSLIAGYVVGLAIGRAVRRAAGGNTVDVVRIAGIAAAVSAALLGVGVTVAIRAAGNGFDLGADPFAPFRAIPSRADFWTLLQLGIAGYAARNELS